MRTITRMYDDYTDAARAVSDLEGAGIPHREISLVANADAHGRATADSTLRTDDRETHSDTGAATGAGVGAVLGGGAGLLAGIGALAIPGVVRSSQRAGWSRPWLAQARVPHPAD